MPIVIQSMCSKYMIKLQRIIRQLTSPRGTYLCHKTRMIICAQSIVSKCILNIYIPRMINFGKYQTWNQKTLTLIYGILAATLVKILLAPLSLTCASKWALEKHYTNHSMRVSNASILTRSGLFTDKEIMEITGHKSVQNLTIYQKSMRWREGSYG